MTPFEMVEEFHKAFDVPVRPYPGFPGRSERALRLRLLREEVREYLDGEVNDDIVNVAGELADIIYIAYGTALAYGIDLDAVFNAVHAANMDKRQPDGTVLRREDGKVIKWEGWQPADLVRVLFGGSR